MTEDLAPSLIIPVNSKPRTAIHLNILPVMYYSGFRIDCDGSAQDFCKDLRKPETRSGFDNIRQSSVPELWDKGKVMWIDYTEKYYKRLAQDLKIHT